MSDKININPFKTPFGELILGSYQDKLCLADWSYRKMRTTIDKRLKKGLNAEYIEEKSPIIEETKIQLQQYFEGARESFDIPLLFVGTDFQKRVWQALREIPFGKTLSYLELSKRLNNEKAIRAVASANGANAISIIIPCHRILGSDGSLVGYAGGLRTKMKLLSFEKALDENQLQLL